MSNRPPAEYKSYQALEGRGNWDSGILKIDLDCWDSFHNETAKLLELGDFIWRGQRNDCKLKSKFDRIVKSPNPRDRAKKLEEHKISFVRAIKGRRGNNPPQLIKDEEIWSLGQHYGLATPLLDWTESPYVAAYFAFRKESINNLQNAIVARQDMNDPSNPVLMNAPSRFIYGLSKDIERWGPAKSKDSPPIASYIEFIPGVSDENSRLLNQRGLFTKPLSEEIDIEETVRKCYAKDNEREKKRIIFVKIKILEIEREKCLRNLSNMNINHATLFPDLNGAAEYCNAKLEFENYP